MGKNGLLSEGASPEEVGKYVQNNDCFSRFIGAWHPTFRYSLSQENCNFVFSINPITIPLLLCPCPHSLGSQGNKFCMAITNEHTKNPTSLGDSSRIPRRGKLSHHSLKPTPLNSLPFSGFLLNLFQVQKHWSSVTQLRMNTTTADLKIQV